MKILWIVNMVFPKVAKNLDIRTSVSGGWLLDLADKISNTNNVELAVMTYYAGKRPIDVKMDKIRYFLLPGGSKRLLYSNNKTAKDCRNILNTFNPDIIHIHGTEYAPGAEMLKVCGNIPVVLTIQGILKRISKEYYGGLSLRDILACSSVKDIFSLKAPFMYKALYTKNAKREEEVLKKVKYVTGRTDWDKTVMLSINPNLQYFRCNYNLRSEFYDAPKWDVNEMNRHSVLTGAGGYSLKGLHVLIKAISIVVNKYPDTVLYVPGGKAENGRLVNPKGYGKYIVKLIKKLNLENNVYFLGSISADEVARQLKKANVLVVPSAMEGASATVCESMMIGTPAICAYRGGMTELLTNGINGFTYDFIEHPMLAERIINIFENDELAVLCSEKSKELATQRHDRDKNANDMIKVYDYILNTKNEEKI